MKRFTYCLFVKQLLLISWWLLICYPLKAQIELSDFEHVTIYDADHGLPSDAIHDIEEDKLGYLWVATDNGVSRFDGNYFMNFKHYYQGDTSYNMYTVHALFMDALNNRLWVGSDKGLFYTSIDTLEFKKYDKEDVVFTAYSSNVQSLYKASDNRLWVGGVNGLLSINLNDLAQPPVVYNNNIPNLNEPFAGIRCISGDPANKNIIWLGCKGLIRFNAANSKHDIFRYKNSPQLDENMIRKLYVTQNEVLMGTWSAGLVAFDKRKATYRKPLDAQFPNAHKLINDIYYDKNNLWITTINGIIQYDCSTQKIVQVVNHDIKKGKIKGVSFVDSRGIIWFGNSSGLFKYSRKDSSFRFIQLENRSKVDVPMNPRRIIKVNEMYYVAGYASAGIYKINPVDYSVETIKIPQFSPQPLGYPIMDMVKMPDDKLLITSNKQMVILDTKSKKSVLSPLQIGHPNPSIQAIVKDRNDNYWVGTRQAGLFKLDFTNNSISCFNKALNEYENDNYVWINKLYIDSHNKLWIAKGSYTVMDLNDEVIHNLNLEGNTFFYKDVPGMQEDNRGRVWMAGGKLGLGYTNYTSFRKGVAHKIDGNFYGVYARNDSLLWTIGNRLGVLNINSMEHTLVRIDKQNEGIKPTGPIIEGRKGEFIIGCKNGLLIYKPNMAKQYKRPSLPYIKEIIANNKPVFDGRNLDTRTFSFNSETTHISVKVSALRFNPTENVTYSYKIKDDWVNTALDNEINFTNLPPGHYLFQLKANNTRASQQEAMVSYYFNILPPWWATWWAYAIYIAAAGLIIFWFYRFQLSKKLAIAESHRLKEVNQLKNSLYTNITHEFRTPLTVILGMAGSLKADWESKNWEAKSKSLEMIERNGNKLLTLVNEMLDLARLENGSMELKQITADVVPFVKYLCESFQSFSDESEINLVVYSEVDELVMDFDTEKLSAIISNVLSNAIKFTPKGGKIVVHLKGISARNNEFFFIKVKDDGVGISEEALPHIFNRFYQADDSASRYGEGTGVGLALTKELVELMDGAITAKSALGKGSEFVIELPVRKTAAEIDQTFSPVQPKPAISNKQTELSEPSAENADLPLALVIEDNTDVVYYLKTCLQGKYKVLHAINGQIGVDMAYDSIPDVIICDVMMPVMDGFEVCSVLKSDERTNHIPIIMLTAKVTAKDRLSGLSHGADAYLAKPFSIAELYIRLDQLIQLRRKMIAKIGEGSFTQFLNRKVENPEAKFLQRAIKTIHSEIDNDLFGPAHLARELHLSESQIYRKLKAISGKSTAVFIRSVRLQKAKEIIQTTDKTIAEVAYEVGFNDPSWFSRAFKEEFGFSPSAIQ